MLVTLLYCECNHFRKRYFPVKCFRLSFFNRIVFFLNTRNTSKVSVRPSETDVPGGLSGLAKHCVQTVHKIKKVNPLRHCIQLQFVFVSGVGSMIHHTQVQ